MELDRLYLDPEGNVVELYGYRGDYLIIKCWTADLPETKAYTTVRADDEYVRSVVDLSRDGLLLSARRATVMHEYHGAAKKRFEEALRGNR